MQEAATNYFKRFKGLDWDKDEDFEVTLRDLTDEFEVQAEVWTKNVAEGKKEQVKRDHKRAQLLSFDSDEMHSQLWTNEAAHFYLDTVEPHFLAPYSGGRTAATKKDLDLLWDMLRKDPAEAERRAERRAKNLNATTENAEIDVSGQADGEDTHMTNGILRTPLKEATEATA